jgi:UMF1 family MFS transporter
MAVLWIAAPGADAPVVPVLIAFAVGLIGIEFAAVFNNAMMPGLVARKDLGKLSGSGWALGYVGGLVTLVIVLTLFSASAETGTTLVGLSPILGLDAVSHEGDRATGPFSAIWYLVFVIPLFVFTPDQPRRDGSGHAVREGLSKLWSTLRALPRRRSYFAFLITSMFYRDGLNALYAFGGIYAAGVLELSIIQIGVFGIVAAFTGAIGAFAGGRADARFGPKRVVFWTCWLLVLACAVVVSSTPDAVLFVVPATGTSLPLIVFYIAGALIGASGGALQAASRTLLVDQVAEGDAGEAFGLYALTGRATAFIGPLTISLMTALSQSQRIGVTPIIALLALGALGLTFVKDRIE